jgi:hypothetical protein
MFSQKIAGFRVLWVLAAVLAVSCVAGARAALLDNFADGDDSGWTHVDVLSAYGLGHTNYDASGGTYQIASSTPLPPLPSLIGTGSAWTASAADPYYSEGHMRMRFSPDNGISNPFGTMRMDPLLGNYYCFFAIPEGAGTIGISKVTGLVDSDDLVSMTFGITPGQWYWMEAGALGNALSLKVWAEGDPEPLTAQLTVTDGSFAAGALAVGMYKFAGDSGVISSQFDDVSFVPEPSSLLLMLVLGVALSRRR